MEDRFLFSSLGVTSANPEDIERNVLDEARIQTGNGAEDEGIAEFDAPRTLEKANELSSSEAKLYSRLRAIDFEIDAVASTVEHAVGSVSGCQEGGNHDADDSHLQSSDGKSSRADDESKDDSSSVIQASFHDSTLHYALASDRLKSLKETRAQLKKELLDLQGKKVLKGVESDKVLRDLVKEKPTLKRENKEVSKAGRNQEKRKKAVSFEDDVDFDAVLDAASTGLVETERDKLVRKGLLTPFHQLKGYERRIQEPETSKRSSLSDQGAGPGDRASDVVDKTVQSIAEAAQARPSTKLLDADALPKLEAPTFPFQRIKPSRTSKSNRSEVENNQGVGRKKKRPLPEKKWRKKISCEELLDDVDGLPARESSDNFVMSSREEEKQEDSEGTDDTQTSFVMLEGGLRIPDSIFSKLFDYQKVGVQWMWELHCQRAGGIIGDEMGLGKTIQVLSFLGALHFSKMYKPSIIVCPVTLLRQWNREARKWYPRFHVEMLHESANDTANRKRSSHSDESEYDSEGSLDGDYEESARSRNTKKWDPLIKRVLKSESGLLITTYEQLRLLGEKLLDIEWGYAVLDEGHRIRNPNAEITLVCKQLQTVHRIIMTGAPIQNKLSELWSLFDFVFPGKLGVLPVFEAEFAVPITVGGYANASPLQVSTAYRCAVVLRDLIMPYLLRRMKVDVNAQLPNKTEHVLFCSLTAQQRSIYRAFLASSEVEQIFDGSRNSLYGIDVMRKICNHPDLLERDHSYHNPDYGNPERSGKMMVVVEVLKVWKKEGHRVLLFAQTQQMLDILENFLIADEYTYRRMDGLTPVKQRMALIDEFNNSEDVFIFILTTKVGGLGTNLTGANRVIIFDPDWNPSTDMQARERAWRIGQTRDVTVYRLITRGTIEEKVYHRQIYKHFLTNKILKNPQQRRFFKARDMKDLFTLTDDGEKGTTETSNIFRQLSEDVNVVGTSTYSKDKKGSASTADNNKEGSVKRSPKITDSQRKGKETADNNDGEVDGEMDILQSLLDAHGIHSALNHDVIMNAHDEEKLKLEEQASQVAQQAAEALRKSRMLRSCDSISVPTWTGKSGSAGAPGSSRQKFGSAMNSRLVNADSRSSDMSSNGIMAGVSAGRALSSAELIAKIRGNQEMAVGAASGSQLGSTPGPSESGRFGGGTSRSSKHSRHVQPEVLIRQICTFLQQRGGSTSSASIVQHFKDRIPSDDLPLFKSLLKEIATLQKDPNGSIWVLKSEYQ